MYDAILRLKYHFKKCVPFTKCITKIDRTTTNDNEGFDLLMLMYNLSEYSS